MSVGWAYVWQLRAETCLCFTDWYASKNHLSYTRKFSSSLSDVYIPSEESRSLTECECIVSAALSVLHALDGSESVFMLR